MTPPETIGLKKDTSNMAWMGIMAYLPIASILLVVIGGLGFMAAVWLNPECSGLTDSCNTLNTYVSLYAFINLPFSMLLMLFGLSFMAVQKVMRGFFFSPHTKERDIASWSGFILAILYTGLTLFIATNS